MRAACHGRGDVLSYDTYCRGRGEGQSVSRRDGCRCGGGPCALCHVDSCACPWSGGAPLAPHPTRANFNPVSWGYIDMPLRDQLAPTILIVGEYSGAMAAACRKRFPDHIAITVDFRRSESSAAHHSVAPLAIYPDSTMAQTGVSGPVVVDGESFSDALFASAGQG